MDVSAVCQYQISDVKKVFEGAYKEYREASQRWGRYTGVLPIPRPGSVRNSELLLTHMTFDIRKQEKNCSKM